MASKASQSAVETDSPTKRVVAQEIARQRARLESTRVETTAQILALEAGGATPAPPSPLQPDARARAAELLNGHAAASGLARGKNPGAELWRAYLEREAIDLALAALSQQELPARAAVLAEMLPAARERWNAVTREIALHLLAVSRLVEDREAIRAPLLKWGVPVLPVPFDPRGNIAARADAKKFIEAAVREKLVGKEEIDYA